MKQFTVGLFMVSILFSSCHKKKTIWNSDWTAPIVNDTLTLDKYVKTSMITVNSGYYELNFKRTILDLNLTEIVKIPDTTFSKLFGIPFSNYTLAPGTSFVNSIEEHVMNVVDLELKKIRLSKGVLAIKLENPIKTPVIFKLQLPGVYKNGVIFEQLYTAPAGTTSIPGIIEGVVDISGYDMDLTGVNGGTFNKLQSRFTVTTDPNGITTSMTNNDITKATIILKDLKIDYARGYFGNKVISDSTTTTIEMLNKIQSGTIDFPASILKFTVTNGLKVPAKTTLTLLENTNSNGSKVILNVTGQSAFQFGEAFNIDPATGSWSTLVESEKVIEFTSLNSNLENYLENLGAIQKIGYSIQLNPWGNSSGGWNEIFPTSRLKVDVAQTMPLSIGLNGLTLKNTFDFNIKQNTEKTHVISGDLIMIATNGFPIAGKIILDLIGVNGDLIGSIIGSEVLQSSLLGNASSVKGIPVSTTTIHFILSKDILSNLELIKKVTVTSVFNTPNFSTNLSDQKQIPEGAFLGIKLKGSFKLENRY